MTEQCQGLEAKWPLYTYFRCCLPCWHTPRSWISILAVYSSAVSGQPGTPPLGVCTDIPGILLLNTVTYGFQKNPKKMFWRRATLSSLCSWNCRPLRIDLWGSIATLCQLYNDRIEQTGINLYVHISFLIYFVHKREQIWFTNRFG